MTLADISLTVNGTPATLFRTISAYGAVYFQVPSSAPTSGTASFIVTQVSTGAVLGVGSFQMAKASPGFYTSLANGLGQVAAQNADGSTNSPANQVARGAIITFYLTGQGQVPNAPPDGMPPSGAIPTPVLPILAIGGVQLTNAQISYSGLGAFPGGWQINATVPLNVAPSTSASVVLSYDGVASNIGGNPNNNADGSPGPDIRPISTTISVK
jgi:uncharacterized protein (TIGR03437 family)